MLKAKRHGRKISVASILANSREEGALTNEGRTQWGRRVEAHKQNVSGPIGKTIPLGDARLSQLDPVNIGLLNSPCSVPGTPENSQNVIRLLLESAFGAGKG